MSSWFTRLFGVKEGSGGDSLLKHFIFEADTGLLTSLANQRQFNTGLFSTPSLRELREQVSARPSSIANQRGLRFQHLRTGDALPLHHANPRACFQVASQFNCLEFPDPTFVPSFGITNYVMDQTQGPACSLACAPSTLVRNYFAGQTDERQINNLQDVELAVGSVGQYFKVRNGYVNGSTDQVRAFNQFLVSPEHREALLERVRVGWHRNCQVVFKSRDFTPMVEGGGEEEVCVSQVFCSAISCAYAKRVALQDWEPLAQLVLDAAYESTLLCAHLDKQQGLGSGKVFLTFLGGGVFGNRTEWIALAMARAIKRCENLDLDVTICHYSAVDQRVESMMGEMLAKM